MSRRVAPIHMGCCPEPPRCLLCTPPPPQPTPMLVEAMVHNYRQRVEPGDTLHVGFFGGAPPSSELLEAAAVPATVRVRPDLLSRADAARLAAAKVESIELDALSFGTTTVRQVGRRHRPYLVREMAAGINKMGVSVSMVLAPGLPGTDYESCLQDAREASTLAQTVRLHPVLVLRDSGLESRHRSGIYRPMTLRQAVTTCRAMMDILEEANVRVIRVGTQPKQDGLGEAVAGPEHRALRQLVEAQRVLDHLRSKLEGTPPGARVVVFCAPADETRTRGPMNQHLRDLRVEFDLGSLQISADHELPRGLWRVERVRGQV